MAAALVAAAWSTRSTVVAASAAVRDGTAIALEQTVRADLADLGGPPSNEELAALLAARAGDGLRFLAMLDSHGRVTAEAGDPVGERPGKADRSGLSVEDVGGRIRVEMRAQVRRA